MTHRLGALQQQSTRSFLVSRALKIAKKKHGQLLESPLKQASALPVASLTELSDAVKFVTRFSREGSPRDSTVKTLASLLSLSMCTVLPATQPSTGGRLSGSTGLTVLDLMELASVATQSQTQQKLSKEAYGELLKLCLSLVNKSDTGTGVKRSVVMEMVDHMIRDWGKEEVRSTAYSSAFQASTNSTQVDNLYKHFKKTGHRPKLDKEVVVQAYLDTESNPRPSLSRLISEDTDTMPSGRTLEQLVLASARANQLQRCLGLYTCMTRGFRLPPSREVFSSVTGMLTKTLGKGSPHHWKLILTSTLLSDTVCVFGDGEVPVWVYAELAQPLTMLLGVTGYEQMVEATVLAAQQYLKLQEKSTPLSDILRNLWDPTVFYSLLHCAHKTANTALALDLLSDMKTLHLNQSKSVRAIDWVRVFEKLLSLVRTRSDLAHYLPSVIEELSVILGKKQINALQDPLFSALMRAYNSSSDTVGPQPSYPQQHRAPQQRAPQQHPARVAPQYLFKASQLLIRTALQATSTNKCIQDLAHFAQEHTEPITLDCDNVLALC